MTKVSTIAVVAMSLNGNLGAQIHYVSTEIDKAKDPAALAKQLASRSLEELVLAYLQAVVDGKRADEVLAHTAALPRGRANWRAALVRIYGKAKDGAALEGTYQNYKKAYGHDFEIIPIGIAAAKRNKNAALAKQRTQLLARATKMHDLSNALSGAGEEGAAARKKLAKLSDADRALLFDRILEYPSGHQADILEMAFGALLVDPATDDLMLGEAVYQALQSAPEGWEDVLERWEKRVATDNAFAARISRLFESSWSWAGAEEADLLKMYAMLLRGQKPLLARAAKSKNKFVVKAVKR